MCALGSVPANAQSAAAATDLADISAAAAQNQASPLGTNLAGINAGSTELPFIDLFKSASVWTEPASGGKWGTWITQVNGAKWDTGEEDSLDLDANGWVKSLPKSGKQYNMVGTLMVRENGGHYAGGKYVVLYQGEGSIEYQFDAQKVAAESTQGRDVINVTPSNNGIWLKITSTDPNGTGNYLRDIHVVPLANEGTYQTSIFNPTFASSINKYSVLRFMDWMKTNNSVQKDWANRPTYNTASYAVGGAPAEVLIRLANRISADAWVNMPHQATDDYMLKFAQLTKKQLRADKKVYVEYSNEVWNTMFDQNSWVSVQAETEPAFQGKGDKNSRRNNWFGQRSAQMCEIWKGVFSDAPNRVVCVMGSQAANPAVTTDALDCTFSAMTPCYKHGIGAVAIAPYFGGYLGAPENAAVVQTWTLSQLFTELNSGHVLSGSSPGALAESTGWMRSQVSAATKYALPVVAYEGGQHLVGYWGVENNDVITSLFTTANRDNRMGTTYTAYLNAWKNAGGQLFMHFLDVGLYSKWGSWGLLEFQGDQTPKNTAVQSFIHNNPRWWSN